MASQRISFEYIELPELKVSFVQRLVARLKHWRVQAAQRHTLAQLDARMLQDIGITEADVWQQTGRRRSLW